MSKEKITARTVNALVNDCRCQESLTGPGEIMYETTFGHELLPGELKKLQKIGYDIKEKPGEIFVNWKKKAEILQNCKTKKGANKETIDKAFPKAGALFISWLTKTSGGDANKKPFYYFFDENGIYGWVNRYGDNNWCWIIMVGSRKNDVYATSINSNKTRLLAEAEVFIKLFETLETKIILGEI